MFFVSNLKQIQVLIKSTPYKEAGCLENIAIFLPKGSCIVMSRAEPGTWNRNFQFSYHGRELQSHNNISDDKVFQNV